MRLRAARGARGRDRRQPAQVQGRRAVRRLGRQGRALHLDLQRVQRPAAVPRRRARLHDRHRGRAPGHHPPRGEDDLAPSREATVPKLSVIVRKAYGAGLYAMAGPAFDPDACLALPTASIAVMGPQAAVNAVFYNQLQAHRGRAARDARRARAARRVRRGHRHPAPGLRARGRRGRPARGPARRAREALRPRGAAGARVAGEAQPDPAGLSPVQGVRRARRSQSTWLCLRMIMAPSGARAPPTAAPGRSGG